MGSTTFTENRYIVRVDDICGGEPIIKGTRIPVRVIIEFTKQKLRPEKIAEYYPQLTLAQIHDALSFYYDNTEEIEKYIESNKIENVLEEEGLEMDDRGFIKIARSKNK